MTCGFCQKPFEGKWFGSKPRCCSEQCRSDLFESRRVVKDCEICGMSLKGKPLISRRCSHECYASIPKSEQMRERVSAAGIGRVQSQETRDKRSRSNRGKKRTPEQIENILAGRAEYFARGPSEEAREKMRAARANGRFKGPNSPRWNPDRTLIAEKRALSRVCYGFIGRALTWMPARQLKEHLEKQFQPGMTWENHGRGPGHWHIDHIRPVASFEPGTPLSVVNDLQNLQPLWMEQNLSKGKKWLT